MKVNVLKITVVSAPNVRIFDRGDSAWKKKYISRLVLAARKMNSAGMKPIILIHSIDGSEDKPIAEAVQELVGNNMCSIKRAE